MFSNVTKEQHYSLTGRNYNAVDKTFVLRQQKNEVGQSRFFLINNRHLKDIRSIRFVNLQYPTGLINTARTIALYTQLNEENESCVLNIIFTE